MPRVIILDSFPLSCMGKSRSNPPTLTDMCQQWVIDCIVAGNRVIVPAIVYYEVLRELERLFATAQIARLKTFVFVDPDRFIKLTTNHLESAARLWAQSRNGRHREVTFHGSLTCPIECQEQGWKNSPM